MKNFFKSPKNIIIAVASIVVLAGSIGLYLLNKSNNNSTTNNEKGSNSQPESKKQTKLSTLSREELENYTLPPLDNDKYPYSYNYFQDPKSKLLMMVYPDWKIDYKEENGVQTFTVTNSKNNSNFNIILDATKKSGRNRLPAGLQDTPSINKTGQRFFRSKKGLKKENALFYELYIDEYSKASDGINISLDTPREELDKLFYEIETMIDSLGYSYPVKTANIDKHLEKSIKFKTSPNRNPLGGSKEEYSKITARFKDEEYKKKTGQEHYALDLVINDNYKTRDNFKLTNNEIFYATCNGEGLAKTDEKTSANVVVINCEDKEYQVEYWHADKTFLPTTKFPVNAGEPIGIIGNTGASYGGKHLHYVIKKNGEYVDPEKYIE